MGLLFNPTVMSKTATFPDGTTTEMKQLVKETQDVSELKKIWCVLLGALEMSSGDISQLVGYHKSHVKRTWSEYREKGESALSGSKGKGNRNRAHLPLEKEKAFLKPFFTKAKKGGVLIVKEIHQAYEKQFKKRVYPSVIYDMLHRHGWRKIAPRPAHPKGNSTDQEIFKVSFPPEAVAGKARGRGKRSASSSHVSG
jgi:transposase